MIANHAGVHGLLAFRRTCWTVRRTIGNVAYELAPPESSSIGLLDDPGSIRRGTRRSAWRREADGRWVIRADR